MAVVSDFFNKEKNNKKGDKKKKKKSNYTFGIVGIAGIGIAVGWIVDMWDVGVNEMPAVYGCCLSIFIARLVPLFLSWSERLWMPIWWHLFWVCIAWGFCLVRPFNSICLFSLSSLASKIFDVCCM